MSTLPRLLRRFSGLLLLLSCVPLLPAQVTVQLVADNDFAVFAGTDGSVTRLVYQNHVGWSSQISAAESFTFSLEAGETRVYILAMGGGGEENVSGRINDVNIAEIYAANPADVLQSSSLSASLTGYDHGSVAAGTFSAALADVQSALPSLSWGAPTLSFSGVVNLNPYAYAGTYSGNAGFNVPSGQAVLFSIAAENLNIPITPIPEPSALALLAGGAALGFALRRRRRRACIGNV